MKNNVLNNKEHEPRHQTTQPSNFYAAPFPPAAGEVLPKLYMEPRSVAPFAAMPKNIYNDHCEFLAASKIEWIVILGDSVARAFGVALMEHLAGDDVRCFVCFNCMLDAKYFGL